MPFKRCNFYDNSGNPRRAFDGTLGCRKYSTGHCRFIHPDEGLWDRAIPSVPPPPSFLADDELPSKRHSSRNRRSLSSDTYRDGPPKHPPIGPKRSNGSYRDSPPPHRDNSSVSRRSRSPTTSISPHDPGPSWQPVGTNRMPLASSGHNRKTPIEPLVNPPPLPPPPSIATGEKPTTPNKEPSATKTEIWLERIKLISESEKHRRECDKLEAEVRYMQRLKQSTLSIGLDEDEKSLITTQLPELQKQWEDKKLELNAMVGKLMETNYWPVLHPPDLLGAEAKYQELEKIVIDLKDVVTKVNDDLRLIVSDQNLGMASSDQGEQAVNVDQRPSKRRRVDDNDEIGIFQDGGQGYAVEEFTLIRDSLENLESRLSDVSNELNQRDLDIMDEIVSAVHAKWEDVGPPPFSSLGSQNGTVVEDSDKLQQIENNLKTTEADVSVLAEEVEKLMTREPDVAAEIQQLKKENMKIRDNCAAHQTRLREMREQMEHDKKAAEALSAALAAHLANPITSSPTNLPQEYILQILDEPIQDSVRAHIKQLLNRLRADLENMIRTKNDELYGALWGRLTLTLKMVDAIARKVNQEPGDVTN